MLRVWLTWTTTKSSYRVFAPGNLAGSSLDGAFMRQSMAAMYAFFSVAEMSPLFRSAKASRKSPRRRNSPLPPDLELLLGACFGLGYCGVDGRPPFGLEVSHGITAD